MRAVSESSRQPLQILGLVVLALAPAMAQCSVPVPGLWRWENCSILDVYPDSSLDSIPAGTGAGSGRESVYDQLAEALDNWYNSISAYSYVDISYTFPAGQFSSNVKVEYGTIEGAPDTTCGGTSPEGGTVATGATMTVNSGSICTDPSLSAYQNYFYKLFEHEFGHVFGLEDYSPSPCYYYEGTVMAQMCLTDDSVGAVPLLPTPCDYEEVASIYSTADDPTCGGGGGGPGGCIEDGGDCTDDPEGCCSTGCNGGWCQDVDPIIIDVRGGGYQLTNAPNGVQFDFYGTGSPIQMSWTAAGWDGGFLVLDRNGNGRIDDGAELFSNLSPQPTPKSGNKNGFLAWAAYDQPANGGNGDGWIDDKDAIYSKLLIWVDKNHNGISDPGELLTLKQAGILRISLRYAPSPWTDAFGNKFRYRAPMMTTASPNQAVYDVLLQEAAPRPASTASTKIP